MADLFDPEFYARAHPTVAARTPDLLRHFCEKGWRELRKPRRDFDVWWYWANHLDPASDRVNPLVHYARVGRAAGLSTRPEHPASTPAPALPAGQPVRRACLFAGFDADGVVDEAALRYLADLSRFADVFCLFDNYLPPAELQKLRAVTTGAWAIRHGAYDVGSYSMLASTLVGWDRLGDYDEVLFVNDSCYLLRPLDEVFARMDAEPCAWWGMQATKGIALTRDAPSNSFHDPIPLDVVRRDLLSAFEEDPVYDFLVGSYFLAFRRPVLDDSVFRRLVESVAPEDSKLAIIQKYEIGLTHLLIGRGHVFSTFVGALYPFHPIFTDWAFTLIEHGFPLLKRYLLYQNHYDVPGLRRWKERVSALVPDAPVAMFEQNLVRTAPHDRLYRSFAITRDDGGTVHVPAPLSAKAFERQDLETRKRDHWWAFAVDPTTHRLPGNSRAIFDEIADDPDLVKIILTRSRRVQLDGVNVVTLPLSSPAGQRKLLGAGVVFVPDDPSSALGLPVSPALHRVIAVRDGLMLRRHGRTAGAVRARRAEQPAPTGPLTMLHTRPKAVLTALLTASDVDQMMSTSSHWPARYDIGWRTGLPAHDHLLAATLPLDLEREQRQLRSEIGDRRLVLFLPSDRRAAIVGRSAVVSPADVERLTTWARDNHAVIGVREPPGDLARPNAAAFGALALDVSPQRFPSTAVVLRSTAVLLTDDDGSALDFLVTGRPAVSFVPDLAERADELFVDLEHLFPGPVCRDVDTLCAALDESFTPASPAAARQYDRVRDLVLDHRDGRNAVRVVERVRRLLKGEAA